MSKPCDRICREGDCPCEDLDYCGCCGGEIDNGDAYWCSHCTDHVARATTAYLWERTYFAQHGEDCPFQVAREWIE